MNDDSKPVWTIGPVQTIPLRRKPSDPLPIISPGGVSYYLPESGEIVDKVPNWKPLAGKDATKP